MVKDTLADSAARLADWVELLPWLAVGCVAYITAGSFVVARWPTIEQPARHKG